MDIIPVFLLLFPNLILGIDPHYKQRTQLSASYDRKIFNILGYFLFYMIFDYDKDLSEYHSYLVTHLFNVC